MYRYRTKFFYGDNLSRSFLTSRLRKFLFKINFFTLYNAVFLLYLETCVAQTKVLLKALVGSKVREFYEQTYNHLLLCYVSFLLYAIWIV